MTPPNKPEWIELAEADSAPQVKNSTRALPALVLAAALSICGIGILFAQNGTEAPASAEVQSMAVTASSSPALQSAKSAVASTMNSRGASAVVNPSAPKQPSIAAMPTGSGDDEDDEREGRDGDRNRGEHEDRDDDDEEDEDDD